ncbi:hypothetical protein H5986_08045 [Fusobacterium mortiferum]|jgi:hypothetical protein|nr:hypothetical protein [Fusobacterium mortiferum]
MRSYIEISVSDFFKKLYIHRSKIELLHAIWNKTYALRNTIYIRNYSALKLFELKLMK